MMRAMYKRDRFVTAWDLNSSCRSYLCFQTGSKGLFSRLKRYARKRQRTKMRDALYKEAREAD